MCSSDLKQEKEAWREKSIQLVVDCIDELLARCEGKPTAPDVFDNWHKKTCEKICEISNEFNALLTEEGFTHELAERFLNLTIENMRLMECWDEHLGANQNNK